MVAESPIRGCVSSGSQEYDPPEDDPMSPEIPFCDNPSVGDQDIQCTFDSDEGDNFSAPNVDLDCLNSEQSGADSQEADNVLVIQPISPSQEIAAQRCQSPNVESDDIEVTGHFKTPVVSEASSTESSLSGF